MQDIIIAVISSVLGSSFIGILVSVYIRRIFSRMDTLEQTVTRLKDDQIAGIDKRLDSHIRSDKTMTHTQKFENMGKLEADLKEHIKNDRSQEILTEIRLMRGEVQNDGHEQKRIAQTVAKQGAEITAAEKYLKNLDGSFQLHKANHK